MAIVSKENVKRRIDLNGPDGNVFALFGYTARFGKQIGYSKEKISEITKEMRESGDYEKILKIFDREFGDYVDLER